jgi:hypothetical protein
MTSEILTAWLAFGLFGSASLLTPLLWAPLVKERAAPPKQAARR